MHPLHDRLDDLQHRDRDEGVPDQRAKGAPAFQRCQER